MASNEIPRSYDPVVELLEDAADGAQAHGAAIGLKQNDEAALRAALGALIGTPAGPGNVPPATPGAKAAWNTAKAAKTAANAAARSARSNGRLLAQTCVGVLKPRLGTAWNSAWQTAGFTNGSLAVPDNPMVLLQQIGAYFTANPTHEVPNIAPRHLRDCRRVQQGRQRDQHRRKRRQPERHQCRRCQRRPQEWWMPQSRG